MSEEIFRNLPQLQTERLVLIKAVPAYGRDLFAFSGDPEATRFMTFATNLYQEQAENAIRWMMEQYEKGEVAPWLIRLRERDRVIGMAGYNWWQPKHARAEISYALARPFWGQGFASEAVRAVIRFGFDQMELNRIEALVHPENLASRRVLEKAGMTAEGLLRQVVSLQGVPADHLIYSLLLQDWEEEE